MSWEQLRFDRAFVDALPGDAGGPPHQSRQTPGVCWAHAVAEVAPRPELRLWNAKLAEELGLPEANPGNESLRAALFAGAQQNAGNYSYAMRYGGHQFGNWAGQLGDGRVTNLGEWSAPAGIHTIQLKGAGRTPYSRRADGRAVLRSSIREYVLSEAMHALGVPTSRALALVTTGQDVVRDMFYDGHPELEPGAIVTRVAPSFLRLGNFEIHAAHEEQAVLGQLLEYCMKQHFPKLEPDPLALYAEVCARTASLMAHWTALGFVHGVLNTDNLSVLGLTIDYGPFGWMEPFDPAYTANDVDSGRRYCFGRQAQMAQWNLSRFGSALTRLGVPVADLESVLREYGEQYNQAFQQRMALKLGLESLPADAADWLGQLFPILQDQQLDMTIFFRGLSECLDAEAGAERFALLCDQATYAAPQGALSPVAQAWYRQWSQLRARAGMSVRASAALMQAANPVVVPRNWMLSQVIESAHAGEWAPCEQLLSRLQNPFAGDFAEALQAKRPQWAVEHPGCGRLTCSS